MIQAENNNLSLTEFSNVSEHYFYGGRKNTTNGFPFLNYSRTSQCGHFSLSDSTFVTPCQWCAKLVTDYSVEKICEKLCFVEFVYFKKLRNL